MPVRRAAADPVRASGSGGASPVAAVPRAWLRGVAVLALLGATVGTALDAVHVHTGTTTYLPGDDGFAGQPWWVPPLFAVAAVGFGLAGALLDRRLARRPGRGAGAVPRTSRMVTGLVLFSLAYVASGLLDGWLGAPSWVTAGVLGVFAVVVWAVADGRPAGWALAVGAAVAGTVVEATLVAVDAFSYTDPGALGVAGWLPVLYLSAGVAVGALGRWLVTPR